ncbi:hypothetical protein PoB_000560000 [Plakobranchus ocellatus]|uniref:Uncharacterized protein n=1 Tax=Plakobranchus ocellatus TaxID=259542 RepID=A0AAV3Y8G8_9GAST|nr:hypothetical protein PoB_000560000 [Plakobranchus ocellatus]
MGEAGAIEVASEGTGPDGESLPLGIDLKRRRRRARKRRSQTEIAVLIFNSNHKRNDKREASTGDLLLKGEDNNLEFLTVNLLGTRLQGIRVKVLAVAPRPPREVRARREG